MAPPLSREATLRVLALIRETARKGFGDRKTSVAVAFVGGRAFPLVGVPVVPDAVGGIFGGNVAEASFFLRLAVAQVPILRAAATSLALAAIAGQHPAREAAALWHGGGHLAVVFPTNYQGLDFRGVEMHLLRGMLDADACRFFEGLAEHALIADRACKLLEGQSADVQELLRCVGDLERARALLRPPADEPAALPDEPAALPDEPAALPDEPAALSDGPAALPDGPAALPDGPAALSDGPAALPDEPAALPDGPAALSD